MKKILGAALLLTLGITSTVALAACDGCSSCGSDADADIADRAAKYLKGQYGDSFVEVASDYTLPSQVTIDKVACSITWTVSDEVKDYITIGDVDAETSLVTATVVNLPETAIEYTLTATVKVGKADPTTATFQSKLIAPLSVAKVKEIASKLDSTKEGGDYYTDEDGTIAQVFVKGYVVDTGTWSDQYNNYSNVYIVDEYSADKTKDSDDALLVYRIAADGKYITKNGDLTKSNLVIIQGFIQNYKGKYEIAHYDKTNPVLVSKKDTRTDAEKVAAAKELVNLDTSNYFTKAAVEVELPSELSGANVSWAVKGTNENVKIENGKLVTVSIPETATTVTLTATITSGSVSDTKDIDIKLDKPTDKGTEEKPYTAAEAIALGATLANDSYYNENNAVKKIYVKGYIIDKGTWAGDYGNFTGVYIADTADAQKTAAFYVYRLNANAQNDVVVGDLVVIDGYMQVYKNKAQLSYYGSSANNPTIISVTPERNEAAKIAVALGAVGSIDSVTKTGTQLLPVSTVSGVEFTWTVKEGTAATVDNNKLKVEALPTADATVTLTVTAKCGEAEDSKDIDVTVKGSSTSTPSATFEAGTYKLSMFQANSSVNKKLYFTGVINSQGYGEMSDDVSKAVDVVVAKVDNGYTFKVGDKFLEVALVQSGTKTYRNIVLVDSTTGAWTYDTTLEVMTWTLSADQVVYLGTYSTYTTIAATYTSYISGDKAADKGKTQFVAGFEKLVPDTRTDAEKAQAALDAITLPANATADINLPVSTVSGVTLSFASDNAAIAVGTDKLTVTRGADDVTVTVTATATIGEAHPTKNFTIVVKQQSSTPAGESATIAFSDTTKRTVGTATEQKWVENGVTFTNTKGSSITDVNVNYSNPVRCYKNSSIKVEFTGITKIVFHNAEPANNNTYVDLCKTSVEAANLSGATVTTSGNDLIIEFATAVNSVEFTASTGQLRFMSIDINPAD